jgi:hypothetical protein
MLNIPPGDLVFFGLRRGESMDKPTTNPCDFCHNAVDYRYSVAGQGTKLECQFFFQQLTQRGCVD